MVGLSNRRQATPGPRRAPDRFQVGNRGSIEINPRGTMAREADIRGVMLFGASQEEFQAMHAAIFAGLEAGTLRPVVGQKFALADARKAHEAVMEHGGAHGKIILIP